MVDAGERAQPRQQLRQQRRVQGAPAAAPHPRLQLRFIIKVALHSIDALLHYCRKEALSPGQPCCFLPPPPHPHLHLLQLRFFIRFSLQIRLELLVLCQSTAER